MPQWLLSTSMLSEVADVFSMQPCQAQTPSVRLKIAVVGTGGGKAAGPGRSLECLDAVEKEQPPHNTLRKTDARAR